MAAAAECGGPRMSFACADPEAILTDPELRRSVILRRQDDFVAFGLRVLELEDERVRGGHESLWPAYADFIDAQLRAALGARASEHTRNAATRDVLDALAALQAAAGGGAGAA